METPQKDGCSLFLVYDFLVMGLTLFRESVYLKLFDKIKTC